MENTRIFCPPKSGSMYYNYKGYFSVILMALVGPDYKFIYYVTGANGRNCDAGIFSHCALSKALKDNTLNIPQDTTLPGTAIP